MKAKLRKDLRDNGELIPTILPEGGWIGESDIESSIYVGYVESSNEDYNGLELLHFDGQLIAVYSIDLDVEKDA